MIYSDFIIIYIIFRETYIYYFQYYINPGFCSFSCLIFVLYSPIDNCLNIGINRFKLHLKSKEFNISSILYENKRLFGSFDVLNLSCINCSIV